MELYLLEEMTDNMWFPVGIINDEEYAKDWVLGGTIRNIRTYRSFILNEVFVNA